MNIDWELSQDIYLAIAQIFSFLCAIYVVGLFSYVLASLFAVGTTYLYITRFVSYT